MRYSRLCVAGRTSRTPVVTDAIHPRFLCSSGLRLAPSPSPPQSQPVRTRMGYPSSGTSSYLCTCTHCQRRHPRIRSSYVLLSVLIPNIVMLEFTLHCGPLWATHIHISNLVSQLTWIGRPPSCLGSCVPWSPPAFQQSIKASAHTSSRMCHC